MKREEGRKNIKKGRNVKEGRKVGRKDIKKGKEKEKEGRKEEY